MPIIRAETGPTKGTTWNMPRDGQLVLGRDVRCGVALADDAASREHARLEFDGEQLVLIDLDSTNYTFVNGQRVGRQVLQNGDEIRIGGTRLSVLIGEQDRRQSSQRVAAAASSSNPRPHLLRVLLIATLFLVVTVIGIAIIGGESPPDPGEATLTQGAPPTPATSDSSPAQQPDTRVPAGVSPDRARAMELYIRGVTHYQLSRLAEAVSMLEEAALLMPEDTDIEDARMRATARYNLQIDKKLHQGIAALEALRFDEARRALRATIDLLGDREDDPRMLEARQLLRRLE